ncbi:DUF885 domain-containing protein [Lysinibacter cavernae]|uniref:Uncharacterized protein (DUF885 family) n=1 Tax=Lysinibacter cavernae TaxID=1640652 RepID=A0A7X5QZY1_9MICO|nr:DUF885 domain-containing protein [Lysinibacter cavernae]NIH53115.1 uncharacterized protein (DUF885 family) [Lysinibacter cavernae]
MTEIADAADGIHRSSPIDEVAERWLDTMVEHDPSLRVHLGLPGALDEYPDYSPAGTAAFTAAAARASHELDSAIERARIAGTSDPVDTITALELRRVFADINDSAAANLALRDVNNIASPVQNIRDVFDLMPSETAEHWQAISQRLNRVPDAVNGYRETLSSGINQGVVPARRQALYAGEQAADWGSQHGFFADLAARAGEYVPRSLQADLEAGAQRAASSYQALATFLTDSLAPHASETDAVGREHYEIASRSFLGATIDLEETYEWGRQQLDSIIREQQATAQQILHGASIADAIEHLDNDPSRQLHGTDALRDWMQRTSDRAVSELGAEHFHIDEGIRRLECVIAPTQTGGIYYTPPSADLSRPGQMWWSVPPNETEFTTWRELTTVYHEGVPGHHLQLAQTVTGPQLNRWRRLANWTSGHGEGWALYAERLMDSLGYLSDPGDRLGMLDGQRMRAARVVLDIGLHLQLKRPDGNGTWDYDYALNFMRDNAAQSEGSLRFEVNRYCGWPGQAPSYSVGQRIWEELRDTYLASGTGTIRDFHSTALGIGGVGLETLRYAINRSVTKQE